MSAFSFVDILLVDLCRSRAAISGAPGSWSRSAICFDYAAKGGVPGKGALSGKGEISGKGQHCHLSKNFPLGSSCSDFLLLDF